MHICIPCNYIEILGNVDYVKHMKKVHGQGFKCEVCGREFIRKCDWEHHMRLKHDTNAVWGTS